MEALSEGVPASPSFERWWTVTNITLIWFYILFKKKKSRCVFSMCFVWHRGEEKKNNSWEFNAEMTINPTPLCPVSSSRRSPLGFRELRCLPGSAGGGEVGDWSDWQITSVAARLVLTPGCHSGCVHTHSFSPHWWKALPANLQQGGACPDRHSLSRTVLFFFTLLFW